MTISRGGSREAAVLGQVFDMSILTECFVVLSIEGG